MKGIERPSRNSARAERAYAVKPDLLIKTIEEAIENFPGWSMDHSQAAEIHAVRESGFFKFKNDVTISVTADATGAEAIFVSASRVGIGDLGQNVRNLRYLTEMIDRRLD